jgi:predicted glycosyltransferase
MPDGWPEPTKSHPYMVDSMFSLVFKRRETWGQMVNESMMLGTPCIFHESFLHSTFTQYLINQDTALISNNVSELVDMAYNITWEQYQTLVNEAYSQSQMYCNDDVRREKLAWLFDKVANDQKLLQ